jgi:hypothetical protein
LFGNEVRKDGTGCNALLVAGLRTARINALEFFAQKVDGQPAEAAPQPCRFFLDALGRGATGEFKEQRFSWRATASDRISRSRPKYQAKPKRRCDNTAFQHTFHSPVLSLAPAGAHFARGWTTSADCTVSRHIDALLGKGVPRRIGFVRLGLGQSLHVCGRRTAGKRARSGKHCQAGYSDQFHGLP